MLTSQSSLTARSEVCSSTKSQPLLRSQHIVGPSPFPKTIPCLSGVTSFNGLGYNSAAKWQHSRRAFQLSAAIQQQSVENQPKEAHKIFDEVQINVKSGNGGTGEIVEAGKGKMVDNFKYKGGGNMTKKMWLPVSTPADGADGADVILVCDGGLENLLHLHRKRSHVGVKGGNGNPAKGSGGPKNNRDIRKAVTLPLEIRVPPGTVVKRRANGALMGELISPGDRLVVAHGGKGGSGTVSPSQEQSARRAARAARMGESTDSTGNQVTAVMQVEDDNWKEDSRGGEGQQLSLHLVLRVVADVGIVGFPNAGKSSLLAALTRASPEVAAYPFTTLMPNLGVMSSAPVEPPAAGQASSPAQRTNSRSSSPVLADLPGLIPGAHMGRGLGRMFLRHLRRTRVLLHVVDASAADPATDYFAVREELRMYNPEYVARPHIVALNKMDIDEAGCLREEVEAEVLAAAERFSVEYAPGGPGYAAEGSSSTFGFNSGSSSTGGKSKGKGAGGKGGAGKKGPVDEDMGKKGSKAEAIIAPSMPIAIVAVSAVSGEGQDLLQSAIRRGLAIRYTPGYSMDNSLGLSATSRPAGPAAAGEESESGAAQHTSSSSSVSTYEFADLEGEDEDGEGMEEGVAEDYSAELAELEGRLGGGWEFVRTNGATSSSSSSSGEEQQQHSGSSSGELGTGVTEEEGPGDDGAEMAGDDDEDLWLLGLSEEELLSMEVEGEDDAPKGLLDESDYENMRAGAKGKGERVSKTGGQPKAAQPSSTEEDDGEDGTGDMAGPEDEDLWMLELTEEEMLLLEVQ